MAKHTRTRAQRENDLRRIAELYLHGLMQAEIAQQIGVCRQQIGYDLKVLQKRWQEAALSDFNARKAQELAKVDELERTYWQAWQESKEIRETTTSTTEKTVGGAGEAAQVDLTGAPLKQKAALKKEQRDGNPAFLAGVERCIARRCEILGLDAPRKGIELVDHHHSGSIALTAQERLELVVQMRKELDNFPEARARLESLFNPNGN
jgi:hypothetical protein